MLRNSDPKDVQKTGLRDARLVVFDDGRRLMFASGFETDWDPYVDDAILIVGIQHFLDWLQHTEEAEELVASVKSLVKDLDQNDPAFAEKAKPAGAVLKATIQRVQTPATTYFNALSGLTIPEIRKAQRLQQGILDGVADRLARPLVLLVDAVACAADIDEVGGVVDVDEAHAHVQLGAVADLLHVDGHGIVHTLFYDRSSHIG